MPTQSTRRLPIGSILADETDDMEQRRRIQVQNGLRQMGARVIVQPQVDKPVAGNELELGSGIEAHPELENNQRFSGHSDDMAAIPNMSAKARMEFENAHRDQEKEKQLKKELAKENELNYRYSHSMSPRP